MFNRVIRSRKSAFDPVLIICFVHEIFILKQVFTIGFNDINDLPPDYGQFLPPTCPRYSRVSPCCTTTLRVSRSSTRSWVLPRWRPRDKPPDRIHSRCTWSCQCRTELSSCYHQLVLQLLWWSPEPDKLLRTIYMRYICWFKRIIQTVRHSFKFP